MRLTRCLSLAALSFGALALAAAPPKSKQAVPKKPSASAPRSEAELEADILLARAKLLRDEGKFREAADVMLKIRGMSDQVAIPPEFHYHLAVCLDKGGEPGLATEAYRQYLKQAGREGAFYGMALEALAKAEAAAKARQEARDRAEATKARAARLEAAIADIDRELARLREENAQALARLDAEADKVSGPFFQAFDAIPWPEKVYGFTSGKLLNFNRQANYYCYKITPGTREGHPIRTVQWGLGGKSVFDYRVEVDLRRVRHFRVVREAFMADLNRYDLVYETWDLKDGERLVEYDSPLWWRPYAWDTEKGHLAKVKRLEEILAPCVKRYAAERPGILERRTRLARLRDERNRLLRQPLQ